MTEEVITIELNPRERRLYDRVRDRLHESDLRRAAGARDVILLLPDLTVLLGRLLRDPRVPRSAKFVAMLGVGYVISPIDLIPGVIFGPIGLVDDLLIVTATLSRILNDVHPDIVRSHWSGTGDVLDAIQRVTRWSETLFKGRLVGLLRGALRTPRPR
ncbi:MAG: DUF1232 domain-containing protein [Myxococcota bacterium]|nr:DUF1232 domain-containing protein [Myxococcota bacterium]